MYNGKVIQSILRDSYSNRNLSTKGISFNETDIARSFLNKEFKIPTLTYHEKRIHSHENLCAKHNTYITIP